MGTILQKVTEEAKTRTCPVCGKSYTGHPALSRKDDETLICPDCGILESLASLGIDEAEQEKILETIHRSMEQGGE